MRAVVARSPGGREVLALADVPDLVAGEGEVLIDVVAAGVNRADISQREGRYPPPPGASELIGLECSGRIAALGAGVDGFGVGDEVCALLPSGGYASQVTVAAGLVLPKPDGVSLVDAAGLPETVCTVWSNVFMLAGLQQGETLLVHGGASGIGTTAIQLARALGARVAATVGSDWKAERCRELGADPAINYQASDFVAELLSATSGHGADVILDVVGAAYLSRNLEAVATNGRLVVIGLQKGATAELNLGALMAKRAAVLATGLRMRPLAEKAAIVASVRENVWPLVAEGHLKPIVDRVLPLAEAAEAHRVIEASEHVGKVLLSV
ncbi:NAD(P)H-quinone oxidoreductase [Tenggerimyces flavus]|uniref:NAD(P)H-quinone oxidoreductase n=1 Tax=Tenggerimyces flavus TaxID=1708749 RepID=A0ABV7YGL6_9ACTN|nr:NAD(P)H-quinone oxidoreductase [Tenggerimyces flavus]MBM7784572.1 putative PIG3 family NAD(P)H quinone oxidoreductase [Tenggerimyces flavus]